MNPVNRRERGHVYGSVALTFQKEGLAVCKPKGSGEMCSIQLIYFSEQVFFLHNIC